MLHAVKRLIIALALTGNNGGRINFSYQEIIDLIATLLPLASVSWEENEMRKILMDLVCEGLVNATDGVFNLSPQGVATLKNDELLSFFARGWGRLPQ